MKRKDFFFLYVSKVLCFVDHLMADLLSSFLHQIGFRPFVEACIEADEKGEALKYIPKLADPRERAEVRPKPV